MSVSKYRMLLNDNRQNATQEKFITIPVELKWDLSGQDDSIDEIQQKIVETVIGKPTDLECARFGNNAYPNTNKTDINYLFHFFNGVPTNLTNQTDWVVRYEPQQFNENELTYNSKPFYKSFFKLDLYDTDNTTTQINYLTLIIPTTNSLIQPKQNLFVANRNKKIKIPKFKMNYLGYKESFFIYWLRNRDYLDLTTFYMTAKFFNGKTGEFIKFINKPQSSIIDSFNFNPNQNYYYKVTLNYTNYTYEVFDYTTALGDIRIGSETDPIKWYQYVNP